MIFILHITMGAWTTNYIYYIVWDEITYPFLNFTNCTIEVMDK